MNREPKDAPVNKKGLFKADVHQQDPRLNEVHPRQYKPFSRNSEKRLRKSRTAYL